MLFPRDDRLFPFALFVVFALLPLTSPKAVCPSPWIEYGDSCYRFERGTQSPYSAADRSCKDHNSILLSLGSSEEHNFIVRTLEDISRRNVFADQLLWWTSGNAVSGSWDGDKTPIKDKKYLPGADVKPGERIVYKKINEDWGWDRVGPDEILPYICEIKRENVDNIIDINRDHSYGVPIRDYIQQQYRLNRAPHIVLSPEDIIFDENSLEFNERPGAGIKLIRNAHAKLQCKADGYPYPDYEWWQQVDQPTETEIDGQYWKKLDIENEVRLTMTNGILLINSPSRNTDAGTYFCLAKNKFGIARSNKITLRFGFLKDFTEEREEIMAKEFDRLVIPCQPPSFFPSITYFWYKEMLPRSVDLQTRRLFSSQKGNLYIAKSEPADSGVYFCQVKNTISETSTIQVSKQIPVKINSAVANQRSPQIEEGFPAMFPQNPLAGMNISIECVAYGDPVPTYEWTRKSIHGVSVPIPSKAIFNSFNRILLLPNIQPSDAGMYDCWARNNIGSVHNSLSVIVAVRPYFDIPMKDQHIDVGKDLTLTCTGRGFPNVEITWWKDGENIELNKANVIAKFGLTNRLKMSTDKRVLTIEKVEPKDKGILQCRAKNDHGEAWSSAEVRVLAIRPNFDKSPLNRKQIAAEKHSTIIVCNPEAAPTPVFTWFKNGVALPDTNILANGNYRINEVSKNDEGWYTCRAENSQGAAESSGMLVVVSNTMIRDKNGPINQILELGASRKLQCLATADPGLDLTYSWSKNDVLIDVYNDRHFFVDYVRAPNELLIEDAGFSQKGTYTCIAVTTVDQAMSNCTVTVHGPPGAPGGVTVKEVLQTSVELQWSPGDGRGLEISSYDVEAITKEDERWIKVKSGIPQPLGSVLVRTTVRELSPGASYRFRVVAYNSIGRGEVSMSSGWITTEPGPPTKSPTNVRGSGGKVGNLQIQWDPLLPGDENGEGIGYLVQWRTQDSTLATDNTPDTWEGEERIMGRAYMWVAWVGAINFYRPYEARVTAFNKLGNGRPSEIVTVMSAENTPQVAPMRIKAIGYNGTAVRVSWIPVEENRDNIRGQLLGYKVNYWPKDYCKGLTVIQGRNCSDFKEEMALHAVFKGSISEAIIIGLDPMTEYTVNAMVFNSAGNGPKSDNFDCKTLKNAPLEPPTYVKIFNLDDDSIKVTWRGVTVRTELEEPVWGYKVRVWDSSTNMKSAKDFVAKGSNTEMDIHDFRRDVQYNLRVLSFSQGGDGRQSSPIVRFVMNNGVNGGNPMDLKGAAGKREAGLGVLIGALMSLWAWSRWMW